MLTLQSIVCTQARIGDLLLRVADAPRGACDCLLESNGVQSLVAEKLGVVIDTGKGAGLSLLVATRQITNHVFKRARNGGHQARTFLSNDCISPVC